MTERPIIGVLQCAHVDADLRTVAGGDYDVIYADLLRGAEPTLEIRAYDATNGELPARTDECDAWILTGSPNDAVSDELWILALRDFVARAASDGARIVGVCFGHQLVAMALGGRVERAAGYAVGPHEMRVEATDWFPGGTVVINAMHRDVVTELPPGARAIATGTTAEIPAYVVGDNVLGVQDHPEFHTDLTAALIKARRERIGTHRADDALDCLRSVPTHGATVASWITNFLLDRRR